MNIIITILVILIISYLLTKLAKKIKVPSVVALIVSGLILGYPALKQIVIEPNTDIIFRLGDAALIFLMFLAGLESSWDFLYNEIKDATFIALFAAFVPFLLGFIVLKLLGFSLLISLIVGICMSITAEATKARVLLELKKLKTRVGAAMMDAGILDDFLGLVLFVLVTFLLKVAYFKEDILIAGAITSFFIGVFVQRKFKKKYDVFKKLESILLITIIPFFFISMGAHFDIHSLILSPYILLIIISIAIIGKLLGALLTKPFTKFSWRQLYLIGWGMNSRGAIELALALIAFRTNLIPVEFYSSLIVMALTTTLIFPFIITRMINSYKKIMD